LLLVCYYFRYYFDTLGEKTRLYCSDLEVVLLDQQGPTNIRRELTLLNRLSKLPEAKKLLEGAGVFYPTSLIGMWGSTFCW
jgi:hypothetical protein